MNIKPLPHGLVGEHLGISHTLKHYLDPAEVWEDLCDEVPTEVRPLAVIAALALERWQGRLDRPPPSTYAHWPALERVHLEGYMLALERHAFATQAPPQTPWLPLSPERFVAHLGAGVIAFVVWWQEQWELRTAYRALRYPFFGVSLPSDPYSRKNRARVAEARALKRLVSRYRAEVIGDDHE